MHQRKVGQDMIIKKQPSSTKKVVSHTPVQTKRVVADTKPVVPMRPKISPVIHDEYSPKKTPLVNSFEKKHNDYYVPRPSEHYESRPPARGGILWFFVGVAFIALVTIVMSLIAQATINLTINESSYSVDIPLFAYAEPMEGQIAFKTAQIVDRQSIIIPTANKEPISSNAAGIVKLFSSNTKQTVIPAGTRLISSTQKVYTTKKSVTIPAGTKENPKSAEVAIVAAAAGADFNTKMDDLKLPAFPLVVARTITEISGGVSGDQFVLSESELIAAKTSLQAIIQGTNPAAFLSNQIPKDYLLPKSLVQVSSIMYRTESVETGVSVIAERVITGNMINKKSFERFLQDQIIPESDRSFMEVVNSDMVNFELPPLTTIPSSLVDSSQITQLPIRITGTFTARAIFDESLARTKIAEQKKASARTILMSIPGVLDADIDIWPPWIGRIPTKVSSIIFKITYQKPE